MRKEDLFFFIGFLFVFIIFIVIYIDYYPNTKFSLFINRKLESITNLIFRDEIKRDKKINELKEEIKKDKEKLSQLKKKLKEESEKISFLKEEKITLEDTLKELQMNFEDHIYNVERIYERINANNVIKRNVPRSKKGKIEFFRIFFIDNDIMKSSNMEKADFELANIIQEKKEVEEEVMSIRRTLNKMLAGKEGEKIDTGFLGFGGTVINEENIEIKKKALKAKQEDLELLSFKEFFLLAKSSFEKEKDCREKLKKMNLEIENKKKKLKKLI